MDFIELSTSEFYEPARAREIEGHVSRAGCHLVSAILHYAVSGRFQHFVGRGRHKSVSARTFVLYSDEYLYHEFFALRLTGTYDVHVLVVLASRYVTPMIAHQRPERISFLLMLQPVTNVVVTMFSLKKFFP